MKVRVKKLYPDAKLPEYATYGSGCFEEVEELSATARGEGGFGSTGK